MLVMTSCINKTDAPSFSYRTCQIEFKQDLYCLKEVILRDRDSIRRIDLSPFIQNSRRVYFCSILDSAHWNFEPDILVSIPLYTSCEENTPIVYVFKYSQSAELDSVVELKRVIQ